jgi:hypothetical protein
MRASVAGGFALNSANNLSGVAVIIFAIPPEAASSGYWLGSALPG